jgi:hypothetical protein
VNVAAVEIHKNHNSVLATKLPSMRLIRLHLPLCLFVASLAFACGASQRNEAPSGSHKQEGAKTDTAPSARMSEQELQEMRDAYATRRWPVIEIETQAKLEPPYSPQQIDQMIHAIVNDVDRDSTIGTSDKIGRKHSFRINSDPFTGRYIGIEARYLRPVHGNIENRLKNSKLSGDVTRGVTALFRQGGEVIEICRRKVEIVFPLNGDPYTITSVLQCDTMCADPNANCEWIVVDPPPFVPPRK